jgi:hypothetical protein
MRITRDRPARKLWISQASFIENLLESFGLSDCNPVKTALPPKFKFRPSTPEDHLLAKDFPFAQVVGSLLRLANTSRPDIAHAASLLSRALSNWNLEHWQAAKGCLRYLRGTSALALTYDASGDDSILEAYCDADWAGCKDTYRSTTGYIVKTYGGTVSWKSVRQATVAKSTTEAEFMASSMSASHLIFLRRFLEDLHYLPSGPPILRNDHMGAVHLSSSTYNHPNTKHINLRIYYLRELVASNEIDLHHIAGTTNAADFFTKLLPIPEFDSWRGKRPKRERPRTEWRLRERKLERERELN